jgi:hypothetical protein
MASFIAGLQKVDHTDLSGRIRSSRAAEEGHLAGLDQNLLRRRRQLEMIFSLIDVDCSGHIEFAEMLRAVDANPLVGRALRAALALDPDTELAPQIRRLYGDIDSDSNGDIDMHEFTKYFVNYRADEGSHTPHLPSPANAAHNDVLTRDIDPTPSCPDGLANAPIIPTAVAPFDTVVLAGVAPNFAGFRPAALSTDVVPRFREVPSSAASAPSANKQSSACSADPSPSPISESSASPAPDGSRLIDAPATEAAARSCDSFALIRQSVAAATSASLPHFVSPAVAAWPTQVPSAETEGLRTSKRDPTRPSEPDSPVAMTPSIAQLCSPRSYASRTASPRQEEPWALLTDDLARLRASMRSAVAGVATLDGLGLSGQVSEERAAASWSPLPRRSLDWDGWL